MKTNTQNIPQQTETPSLNALKQLLVTLTIFSLITFSLLGVALIQHLFLEELVRTIAFSILFSIGFGCFIAAIEKIAGPLKQENDMPQET